MLTWIAVGLLSILAALGLAACVIGVIGYYASKTEGGF
jgi:hypothetical protein